MVHPKKNHFLEEHLSMNDIKFSFKSDVSYIQLYSIICPKRSTVQLQDKGKIWCWQNFVTPHPTHGVDRGNNPWPPRAWTLCVLAF